MGDLQHDCHFYCVSATKTPIHTFLMLLSVNLEVFWNLAELQFLPFCCCKLRQLLLFVLFFFLPICLGVCVLSAEAWTCIAYVQSAQRRHAQNLSPKARWLVCSLWPWKWEHWDMRCVAVGSLRPVSLVSFGLPSWRRWRRLLESIWLQVTERCNGSSQGDRERQGGVPPGRAQGSLRNCTKVQNAAGFLGGSGIGKLKVAVITLPESLSWPEESIYKHYALKWKLLFSSERSVFYKVIRISNRSVSC